MRKILNIIFSTRAGIFLLLLFSITIAIATFIENEYDTSTADILIYNAKWFEILLLLIAINFIGNIEGIQNKMGRVPMSEKRYKKYKNSKLSDEEVLIVIGFIVLFALGVWAFNRILCSIR